MRRLSKKIIDNDTVFTITDVGTGRTVSYDKKYLVQCSVVRGTNAEGVVRIIDENDPSITILNNHYEEISINGKRAISPLNCRELLKGIVQKQGAVLHKHLISSNSREGVIDIEKLKLNVNKNRATGDRSYVENVYAKPDGTIGIGYSEVIEKAKLIKAPTILNEREKEMWKAEMNGGWTTNSMSVVLINPMVLKNKTEWQFVSLTGANLNFKPTNFKIEICTGDSTTSNTNVVATIDNSKVQLINRQTLGFWLNVVESNLSNGDYKIRLSNGVATYLTPMVFKVLEVSQVKPLIFTNSQSVLLQSGNSDLQVINSAKDVILSPDANIKALANVNGKDIVAQFQTDKVLKGSENWHFELVIDTQQMQNGALISSYFGLSSSEGSSTIISTLDFEFLIGKTTWNGSTFMRGLNFNISGASPTLRFLKYQNLLIIVVSSSDGRYNSVASRNINTDTNYRLVFSKNNCGSVNSKTGFFITNEYKF